MTLLRVVYLLAEGVQVEETGAAEAKYGLPGWQSVDGFMTFTDLVELLLVVKLLLEACDLVL